MPQVQSRISQRAEYGMVRTFWDLLETFVGSHDCGSFSGAITAEAVIGSSLVCRWAVKSMWGTNQHLYHAAGTESSHDKTVLGERGTVCENLICSRFYFECCSIYERWGKSGERRRT